MRALIIGALLTLFSCGQPTPQVALPSPETTTVDTIPTIQLSEETDTIQDYPILLQISSTALHLDDGSTLLDKIGPINSIELRIEKDSVVYCKINNTVTIGEAEIIKEWVPPFKMLDANHVLVMEGANLSLIAKYYNKRIETLKLCNSIKDIDFITAGTVLKLSCCEFCK